MFEWGVAMLTGASLIVLCVTIAFTASEKNLEIKELQIEVATPCFSRYEDTPSPADYLEEKLMDMDYELRRLMGSAGYIKSITVSTKLFYFIEDKVRIKMIRAAIAPKPNYDSIVIATGNGDIRIYKEKDTSFTGTP